MRFPDSTVLNKRIYLLFFFLFAGCGPMTAEQLRASPAGVHTFRVDSEYQAVYAKVLERARTCYEHVGAAEDMTVKGDLARDAGRSSISVIEKRVFAAHPLFTIDMTQVGPAETEVNVYYSLRRFRPMAFLVQDWIESDSHECRLIKPVPECVCFLGDEASPPVTLFRR
jgi:hypothetical protein